jgi:hypothetical protein
MNFETALAKSMENPFEQNAYEKAGVRIEASKFENLPEMEKRQFAIFGPKADEIYESYKAVIHWLKLPYVHDNFGEDHLARRKWFKTLSKEENLEMLDNKFRNNPVTVMVLHLNNLKMLLELPPNDANPPLSDNKINFTKLRQTHDASERRRIMEAFEGQCETIIDYLNARVRKRKLAA